MTRTLQLESYSNTTPIYLTPSIKNHSVKLLAGYTISCN
jgi:hypothetical protein